MRNRCTDLLVLVIVAIANAAIAVALAILHTVVLLFNLGII